MNGHNLQELSHGRGQGNERSASVQDDTGVLELGNIVAKGNGIKVDLPVGLAAKRNRDQFASVVALVNTTKSGFRVVVILVGVTQVESKLGLIQKLLVQHVVEGGNHLVHRDGVVSKTQDTIKATESESQARLFGSLSKVLVLDLEVADLQGILRDKAAQTARAVANGEFGTVLLVGARRRRVILAVKEAGDRVALGRRNPQVGATGVQDNLEGLRRSTERDLREVWEVSLMARP